jgi:membrane protease YdiL (CAAX protease family)
LWATVVAAVAGAEELFLRGAFFDSVTDLAGRWSAIVVAAFAFAALHVPLYGWHVVPLDLAVGIWLGALRTATGTWVAPAVAHVAADLGGGCDDPPADRPLPFKSFNERNRP